MNLITNIPNNKYEWIKDHEEGITDYQTTQILYNQVRNARSLEDYLDEIKGVVFKACEHLEDKDGIVKIVLDILDKYKEGEEG